MVSAPAGETTLYYCNHNWQVLTEYDGANNLQRKFIYGNGTESPQWRIDEVLLMIAGENDYYYAHDHLYSPAALIDSSGTVLERCEYDAYGNCSILEPNFAPDPDGQSDYGNPYAFQGKNLDLLDNGGLELMYWPYRNYSTYLGRWLQAEKLGMIPNDRKINLFGPGGQYADGMNLYEYVGSNPVVTADPLGLQAPISIGIGWPTPKPPEPDSLTLDCPDGGCPTGWLDPLPSTGRDGDWGWIRALLRYIGRSGRAVEFRHTSRFSERVATASPGIGPSWRPLKRRIRTEAKSRGMHLSPCECTSFSFSGISHEGYLFIGSRDWIGTLHRGDDDEYSTLRHTVRCCVKNECDTGILACRVRFDLRDTYSFDISSWPPARYFGVKFDHIVHFDKTLDENISLP